MPLSDTLDSMIKKQREPTTTAADRIPILDAMIERNRVSYGSQLKGTAVSALPRAAASVARSSAAVNLRAPKASAAVAFDGKTFDSFMGHLSGMEAEDAYKAKRADSGLITTVDMPSRVPSLFKTFDAGAGGKDPYEIAKGEAMARSAEIAEDEPLDDDPQNWPVSPRDVAMEGWAERMGVAKEDLARARMTQLKIADRAEGWTAEKAQWASTYAEMSKHNIASQAVLDFTSNWPNLAAAAAGAAVDKILPGAGAAATFGFMAAQEEGDAFKMAEAAGIPAEFAAPYCRKYGLLSGGVEYSEQIINLAGLSGKTGSKAAKTLRGKVIKGGLSVLASMGMEGGEEVTQQAMQFGILAEMLRDYAKQEGKSVALVSNLDALPVDDNGNVDWWKARGDLFRAFQAGAGVAAVSNIGGIMRSTPGVARSEVKRRRAAATVNKVLTSPKALEAWARGNPEQAKALAGNEKPSRKDFDKAGLPRLPAKSRQRITSDLKELLPEIEKQAPAPKATPKPSLQVIPPPLPEAAPEASAVAGQAVETDPTDAQKEADNYKKGHTRIDGHDVSIENPVGSERTGKNAEGKEWSQTMTADYGYLRGTVGYDKDHLDVFVKPGYDPQSSTEQLPVHVVNQVNPETGKFDEHKVVFGARDAKEATEIYNSNYEDGWKGAQSTAQMSAEEFKAWAYDKKNGPSKGALAETAPAVATDLTKVSDDEFDKLMDEVEGDLPVETPQAPVKKIGRKGVKKAVAATPAAPAPGASIASAAQHGAKGLDEAAKGLYDLFGGGLVKSGPIVFDEETYAKARPHFEKAYTEFKAAGQDLREFIKWAMNLGLGGDIRPFLKRFKKDLESKPITNDTNTGGGTANEDQGRYPGTSTPETDADTPAGTAPTGSSAATDSSGSLGEGKSDAQPVGDVRTTEPAPGDVVPGDGVSTPPVGVGGQQPADDGGENLPNGGKHGLVPESSGTNPDGPDGTPPVDRPDDVRRGNYDLRAKPGIRLTKKQRRDVNKQAKALLDKPHEDLTDEDLEILRQYTGEGGLSSGSREALNQHYTGYDTIRAMFRALRDAGVKLNKLLEPGVGSGNFVGHAPDADWTTVDIDETNHRVVSALYPDGKHYNISFEEFAASGFDAVISNVPFSEVRGKGRNKARPDVKHLHDFYFLHSLDRVRENGVIAFVTSKGTMDRLDPKVRAEIISKADVIGAFRLPSGHFEANAHTKVTTDIVFMQRRPDGVEARPEAAERNELFAKSTKTVDDIALNEWYQAHPTAMLGDVTVGKDKTRGGKPAYEIAGPARLDEIAINYKPYGVTPGTKSDPRGEIDSASTDSKEFAQWAEDNNIVTRTSDSNRYGENIEIRDGVVYSVVEEVEFEDIDRKAKIFAPVKGKNAAKIRHLYNIRRLATEYQAGDEDAGLGGQAEVAAYREEYGKHPAKDRALRKFFKGQGEETYLAELASAFTSDMHPADVFFERTRHEDSGRIKVTKDDDLLSQAVAAEDNKGKITFPTEQGFVTEADALDLMEAGYALAGYETYADTNKPYSESVPNEYYVLGWAGVEANHGNGRVFSAENTKTGEQTPEFSSQAEIADWLNDNATAADLGKPSVVIQNDILYYSGNIYEKLEQLAHMRKSVPAEYSDALDRQEAKLQEIMPEPKPLEEITLKGSESWLMPFLQRAGIGITTRVNDDGMRIYYVGWDEVTDAQAKALEKHMNNHVLVSRRSSDGVQESVGSYMARMRDAENDLRDALEILKNTLLANDGIREAVEKSYNSRYRNYVKPNYEQAQYLIQPVLDEIARNNPMIRDSRTGKMVPLKLRRNQISWVIQALYEGRGINAHDVGGGKTMAAIVLVRALKVRGRSQKPMMVVPAKTLKKWAKETQLLFPDAKIVELGALSKRKRNQALFELANTNADYVFISHEGFGKIKLPVETEIGYVNDAMNEHVDDPNASGRQEALIQEQIEAYIDSLQNDGRDTRLTWDKLGIDAIISDEAHAFKNIGINSQLVRFKLGTAFGFNRSGRGLKSARSYDFRFKANYTTERNNGGNVFLLTATPTPNKPMEIYTMLRHFGPGVFSEYGIKNDRDFASTFFQLGTAQDPATGRPKSILRAIVNAQELRGLLNRFVDKMSMSDMPWISIPDTEENRIFVDQSAGYAIIAEDLIERQKNLPKPPSEGDDTLVAIYTGGRSGSVDPRLYGGAHAGVQIDVRSYDKNDDKVQWAIEQVALVAEGNPEAGQLVFMDDSGHTRTAEGHLSQNVHREIKEELIARGFDAKQIAVINGKEITNPKTGREVGTGSNADEKKAAIQDAYNAGEIKVLIGSTASMGEGMDLQVKTTDIYHMDIPYTPGAIHQRNGRGVRPGNENAQVNIHYLMMRGSFDSMSLGIVLTKKGWNEAIWDRDVADTISTEEEMVAGVIPNNRQIMMELERDPVRRKELEVQFTLESMQTQLDAWRDEHYSLNSRVRSKERRIRALDSELASRGTRLEELEPDTRIKNEEKRAEQFVKSKAYMQKLMDVSARKIQEERASIEKIQTEADALRDQISALHRDIETYTGRWYNDNGESKVTEDDVKPEDDGILGFGPGAGPARGGMSPSLINSQDTAAAEAVKPVQAADIINTIKRQWVGLSIRGKATFRRRAMGWYNTKLGEMRLLDIRNVTAALHEVGHHFDRQMQMWSKSKSLPDGIPGELIQLGRDLYGDQKPGGGYRAEGFAEFIRDFLTGGDIQKKAPKLYEWFTTEYLTARPKEAAKLRKLEQLVTAFRTQTPGQTVRAFRSPIKQDWSAARTWSRFTRWVDLKWRDINLALIHAMKDAEIDWASLSAEADPYMLATAYSMSASGKAHHAALVESTGLDGRRTGGSLLDALAPISALGRDEVENWTDYAIARRAQELHDRGINPGISLKDADDVVDKYRSATFDQALDEVTEWSRNQMRLLVESGAMTTKEFEGIEESNPVYVPFSRQFAKDELRPGKGGRTGRGVYRIKGSGREIHNPIDALIMQAEQITQAAMQADIVRALVNLYDAHKGARKGSLGQMMSEVPAPQTATTFSAEKIKKEMAAKALELGADPEAVAEAMMDTWTDQLTVFSDAKEYHGKDHVVTVVINGERRFFEVGRELYKLLNGLNKGEKLSGVLGKVSRPVVGLQRLGATGLNPAFGLIRNFLRDAGTTAITYDYAKGGPFATLFGLAEELAGSEYSHLYHAMSVDLSGWVGHTQRSVKNLARKVTAVTKGQKVFVTVTSPIQALREVFGVSEAGPRLAEFKAAYKYAKDQGQSDKSAAITAAVAGKDASVNFTRAGEYGRIMNEVVLFFNAGVQSIDKFGRTFYKHPGRTLARGAGWITFASMIAYYRNRDEEWWKELPEYEKWSYVHWKLPGGKILRAPLPFEFGIVFGALPVAAIEEQRSPGAFFEAVKRLQKATVDGDRLMPALLSPLWDVKGNEDWKGSAIVPRNIKKNRLPVDQYTTQTTELAKRFSRLLLSDMHGDPRQLNDWEAKYLNPAALDHLLNSYTGGLYRRTAMMLEKLGDPSAIGAAGDWSTIPVVGTLFLRHGTSRITGDFYDRIDELRQIKGSQKASVAEIGELAASERLNRKLQEMWKERREVISSETSAGKVKTKADALINEIHNVIRAHRDTKAEEWRAQGAGAALYAATSPGAESRHRDEARRLLGGMSIEDQRNALRGAVKLRAGRLRLRASNGKLTSFGMRLARLRSIGIE